MVIRGHWRSNHWICPQLPRRFRSRLFYLIWPEIDLIFTKFSPFLTNERGDAPETLPMARTGQEEFLRKLGPVPFLWGSLIILGMPGSNWRSKGQILRSQGKRGHFFSEISSTIAYCTPPPLNLVSNESLYFPLSNETTFKAGGLGLGVINLWKWSEKSCPICMQKR